MIGLGDNLYQVPLVASFARHVDAISLETPFPALYRDIPNLLPVRPRFAQERNPPRWYSEESERAAGYSTLRSRSGPVNWRIRYTTHDLSQGMTIQRAMERGSAPVPTAIEWPAFDEPFASLPAEIEKSSKPLALVRPVTNYQRRAGSSRSCLPEYVAEASIRLMDTHTVVSLARIDGHTEAYDGEPPAAHHRYDHGELSVLQVLEVARRANRIAGGVGWIIPAAMAFGVRTLAIYGGLGAHNNPAVLVDPRARSGRFLTHAVPERFCMCRFHSHECESKRIERFSDILSRFLE
jgi:hypothetical protein